MAKGRQVIPGLGREPLDATISPLWGGESQKCSGMFGGVTAPDLVVAPPVVMARVLVFQNEVALEVALERDQDCLPPQSCPKRARSTLVMH